MATNYYKVSVWTDAELGTVSSKGRKKNYRDPHLPIGDIDSRRVYSWFYPFDAANEGMALHLAQVKFNAVACMCKDAPTLSVWRRFPGCKLPQIGWM